MDNGVGKDRKRKKKTVHTSTEGKESIVELAHVEFTPEVMEDGGQDSDGDGDRWRLMTLFNYKIPEYLSTLLHQSNQ